MVGEIGLDYKFAKTVIKRTRLRYQHKLKQHLWSSLHEALSMLVEGSFGILKNNQSLCIADDPDSAPDEHTAYTLFLQRRYSVWHFLKLSTLIKAITVVKAHLSSVLRT